MPESRARVGTGRAKLLAKKARQKSKPGSNTNNRGPAGMGVWATTRTTASAGMRNNSWRIQTRDWKKLLAENEGLQTWLELNGRERDSKCKGKAECAYCKETKSHEEMVNCDHCALNWDASCLRQMNRPVPLINLLRLIPNICPQASASPTSDHPTRV